MSRLPVILLALLLSLPATAELNKWIDEHGNVIYSDLPPPAAVKAEILHSSPAPAAPAETTAPATESAGDNAEAAKQDRSRAAVEAENRRIAKANCASAQQNLRTLQSGMRLAEINEAGETVYLEDAQREQRIAKTKQDIAEWCN